MVQAIVLSLEYFMDSMWLKYYGMRYSIRVQHMSIAVIGFSTSRQPEISEKQGYVSIITILH